MSNANCTYDTKAIRREARKIKQCCDKLDSAALPRVDGAKARLDGNFMGRTADALDDRLTETKAQLRTLNRDLNALYTALMRFADALEEADARIARLMGGK